MLFNLSSAFCNFLLVLRPVSCLKGQRATTLLELLGKQNDTTGLFTETRKHKLNVMLIVSTIVHDPFI